MTFKEVLLKHGFTVTSQCFHTLEYSKGILKAIITEYGNYVDLNWSGCATATFTRYYNPDDLDKDLTKSFVEPFACYDNSADYLTRKTADKNDLRQTLKEYGFQLMAIENHLGRDRLWIEKWVKGEHTIKVKYGATPLRIVSDNLLIPEDHLPSYLANKYPKSPTFESVLLKHGYGLTEGFLLPHWVRTTTRKSHRAVIQNSTVSVFAESILMPYKMLYYTAPIGPTPEQLDTILSVIAVD